MPKAHNGEFVWRMEDVLEVYSRPYDKDYPVICMDESSKQLLGEVRQPLAMRPGDPQRIDSEYKRQGTCNLFMFCQPLVGWREVRVTDRRTKIDWAHALKDFLDTHYLDAKKVVLVMDNLNTHNPGSFFDAFAPDVATALTERLEIHYTPKHGSWLNIAECEFSALSRQCLSRRIKTAQELADQVRHWTETRNNSKNNVNWQFTSKDARTKLRKLYPDFSRADNQKPTPLPTKTY